MNEINLDGINDHQNIHEAKNKTNNPTYPVKYKNLSQNNEINQEQKKSQNKIKKKNVFPKYKNDSEKTNDKSQEKQMSDQETATPNIQELNEYCSFNCSFNNIIYNNISSIFSFPTNSTSFGNNNHNMPNSLLPLFLSNYKHNYLKNFSNDSIQKLLFETNYNVDIIKKFCEFLFQNGFNIMKKSERIDLQQFSSSIVHRDIQCSKSESKKTKEIRNCPHIDRKHYAKNMCNNCYHRQGRVKKAWLCPHDKKAHYAKGRCQICYLNFYHEKKVINNLVEEINNEE